LALVLPTLGCLFIWHVAVLGVRLATLHLGVGLALAALLMELFFLHYRRLPFASGFVSSGELRSRGALSLLALLLASFTLAWIERAAATTAGGYLLLVAIMAVLVAAVMTVDRAWRRPAAPLELDEPPPLPTQRLDLAG
jgi:hypothetical protein